LGQFSGLGSPRLRLNSRFHANLMEQAVPLDRHVVAALAAEPLALDAHGWIRHLLNGPGADQPAPVAWDDLLRRFGSAGQELVAFQEAFEDALRMVYAADHSIALAADEAGVTVGFAAAAPEAAPAPMAVEKASPAAGAMPSGKSRGTSSHAAAVRTGTGGSAAAAKDVEEG
jgi:hypothetical protein